MSETDCALQGGSGNTSEHDQGMLAANPFTEDDVWDHSLTTERKYDEVLVKEFHPGRALEVRFRRADQKPTDRRTIKLTREEALWLLCEHAALIDTVCSMMDMGHYDTGDGASMHRAWTRIDKLVSAGLLTEPEVASAIKQIRQQRDSRYRAQKAHGDDCGRETSS